MKKIFLPFIGLFTLCFFTTVSAQQKRITVQQAFHGASTNIEQSLPAIRGWADNDNYLEMRPNPANDNKPALMAVNVKTGKAIVYSPRQVETSHRPPATFKDATNPTASPDGKWTAFTRNNDLYITNNLDKKEIRLTTDGSEYIKNGYASWVYFEEILGRASRYRAFWWSPDSKSLAFMRFDDSEVPVYSIYVAEGQHGYWEKENYPKPGDKNPEVKIGIANIASQNITWADVDEKKDQYFGQPIWTPNSELWIQWMNRGQDQLKILKTAPTTGKLTPIYDEIQKTWISLDETNRITFLDNGKEFILRSDKTGWEHLYLHKMDGSLINPITTGNYTVANIIKIDEKKRLLYFTARKENSARFDFYSVGLDGKGLTRLSFGEYSFSNIQLSPNATYFVASYSNSSTPTTAVLVSITKKGAQIVRELGNVKGKEFENYALPKTEIILVKSFDGLFDLPVQITYPVNFDPAKKYPVLVSIYGGPNAGRVYDNWGSSRANTIWWAQEGLIQVGIDNRSSGHFGKAGMNYIHRNMGKYEIEDYMAGAKWLKEQSWVDDNRIAITGGSFGGYLTCMALTYGADYFTHGIANASVTDWLYYDTHYTERFMDTPKENPEGYKETSVMTHAHKYKGLLRIVHGTSDDNVHMQHSIALISRLQNLGRHFELMIYPGERHGIGAANRLKGEHNRNEAYSFYYQHLLNKPMPREIQFPL